MPVCVEIMNVAQFLSFPLLYHFVGSIYATLIEQHFYEIDINTNKQKWESIMDLNLLTFPKFLAYLKYEIMVDTLFSIVIKYPHHSFYNILLSSNMFSSNVTKTILQIIDGAKHQDDPAQYYGIERQKMKKYQRLDFYYCCPIEHLSNRSMGIVINYCHTGIIHPTVAPTLSPTYPASA